MKDEVRRDDTGAKARVTYEVTREEGVEIDGVPCEKGHKLTYIEGETPENIEALVTEGSMKLVEGQVPSDQTAQ